MLPPMPQILKGIIDLSEKQNKMKCKRSWLCSEPNLTIAFSSEE
jgi:hypothetical protein